MENVVSKLAQQASVDASAIEGVTGQKIRLSVPLDRVEHIANLDSVRKIEEVRSKELRNNLARVEMNAVDMTIGGHVCLGKGQVVTYVACRPLRPTQI